MLNITASGCRPIRSPTRRGVRKKPSIIWPEPYTTATITSALIDANCSLINVFFKVIKVNFIYFIHQ